MNTLDMAAYMRDYRRRKKDGKPTSETYIPRGQFPAARLNVAAYHRRWRAKARAAKQAASKVQ